MYIYICFVFLQTECVVCIFDNSVYLYVVLYAVSGGVTIVTEAEQDIVYKTTARIARSVSVGNVTVYRQHESTTHEVRYRSEIISCRPKFAKSNSFATAGNNYNTI